MTNADRIRQMTTEELAEFLDEQYGKICSAVDNCGNCGFDREGTCESTLEWLESEVDT